MIKPTVTSINPASPKKPNTNITNDAPNKRQNKTLVTAVTAARIK